MTGGVRAASFGGSSQETATSQYPLQRKRYSNDPVIAAKPVAPTTASSGYSMPSIGVFDTSTSFIWGRYQVLALTRLSEHLADNRRHVRCRESSQRLGADVAQGTQIQVKRPGGKLIRRIEDCHNIIPSLRPE